MTIGDTQPHSGAVAQTESIGQWMKRKRISKHMTQKQLGDEIGVKDNQISQIETGHRKPSPQTAVRAAKVLEDHEDYVLGLAGYPPLSDIDMERPGMLRLMNLAAKIPDESMDLAYKLLEAVVDENSTKGVEARASDVAVQSNVTYPTARRRKSA